jgi:hypothetical protein
MRAKVPYTQLTVLVLSILKCGGRNEQKKRILGIREKQILYQKANHKCEACGKEIDFTEMKYDFKELRMSLLQVQ